MPYTKGKLKGQLTISEIRKLISAHNRLTDIKIKKGSTRDDIIKLLKNNGYMVDHGKQSLIPTDRPRKKIITLTQAKEVTKQKPKTELQKQKSKEKKEEKEVQKKKEVREIKKKVIEEQKSIPKKKVISKPVMKQKDKSVQSDSTPFIGKSTAPNAKPTYKPKAKPSPKPKSVKPAPKQDTSKIDTFDKLSKFVNNRTKKLTLEIGDWVKDNRKTKFKSQKELFKSADNFIKPLLQPLFDMIEKALEGDKSYINSSQYDTLDALVERVREHMRDKRSELQKNIETEPVEEPSKPPPKELTTKERNIILLKSYNLPTYKDYDDFVNKISTKKDGKKKMPSELTKKERDTIYEFQVKILKELNKYQAFNDKISGQTNFRQLQANPTTKQDTDGISDFDRNFEYVVGYLQKYKPAKK
jgi:hypothetical protein